MRARSIRNLLDLPLITRQQVQTGEITDAWLDPTEQRLMKLSIAWDPEDLPLTGPDEAVPFRQIVEFAPHHVVVASELTETAGLDLLDYDAGLWQVRDALLDHDVVTPGGRRLGTLVDIHFDEEDGAILGYEIAAAPDAVSRILGPSTDMDLRGGELVVPERLTTVQLPEPEEVEPGEVEEEDLAIAGMGELPLGRTEDPSSEEEGTDPNDYPPGHQAGEDGESPEAMLG